MSLSRGGSHGSQPTRFMAILQRQRRIDSSCKSYNFWYRDVLPHSKGSEHELRELELHITVYFYCLILPVQVITAPLVKHAGASYDRKILQSVNKSSTLRDPQSPQGISWSLFHILTPGFCFLSAAATASGDCYTLTTFNSSYTPRSW